MEIRRIQGGDQALLLLPGHKVILDGALVLGVQDRHEDFSEGTEAHVLLDHHSVRLELGKALGEHLHHFLVVAPRHAAHVQQKHVPVEEGGHGVGGFVGIHAAASGVNVGHDL